MMDVDMEKDSADKHIVATTPIESTNETSATSETENKTNSESQTDDTLEIQQVIEPMIEEIQAAIEETKLTPAVSTDENAKVPEEHEPEMETNGDVKCDEQDKDVECSSNSEEDTDESDEEEDDEYYDSEDDDIVEVEPEETPVIEEALGEISVEIYTEDNSPKLCFVCKKDKDIKYVFTHKTKDEETDINGIKEKHFVCADNCYSILKNHVSNIITPNYFSKVLDFKEEDKNSKHIRRCKQCAIKIRRFPLVLCLWEGMEFCMDFCLLRFQMKFSEICAECDQNVEHASVGKYAVRFGNIIRQFCCSNCLNEHKKKICICSYCQVCMPRSDITVGTKYFCTELCKGKYVHKISEKKRPYISTPQTCYICEEMNSVQFEFAMSPELTHYFCNDKCLNIFRQLNNATAAHCCRNCNKYGFDNQMEKFVLRDENGITYFCSETCRLIQLIANRKIESCMWCRVKKYNFDLIKRHGFLDQPVNVCSMNCLSEFKHTMDVVCGTIKKCKTCGSDAIQHEITMGTEIVKYFCSHKCMREHYAKLRKRRFRLEEDDVIPVSDNNDQNIDKTLIFIQEEMLPEVANKMCMVRPLYAEKSTQITKVKCDSEAQTDFPDIIKLLACPVPIYIPQPLRMWHCPLPRAVPFPLVVPIPLLIPLTRDPSTEYLKTMKRDTVKTPTDPFEAELLMMAELVAAEKPKEESEEMEEEFSPEPATDTAFNDDVLQMALKMATDYHEPAVDLEGALTASTITPGQHPPPMELTSSDDIIHTEPLTGARGAMSRGRGRGRARGQPRGTNVSTRGRGGRGRPPAIQMPVVVPEPVPPPPPPEPLIKPDANMCLKYTFGVNAWKQWVVTKNAELERSSRKLKLFKTDILQMTADELNYSLCLFVNEVRKPNGADYAPDTIYYLCLGIQQYLYESGRIDNIFCDNYYEKFTDCLDEVCGKFSNLYNDSHYIVTRVEEEHLWESKQLGAHSPFVLLTTLMFFNTKHFNLTTVEEHMQLSFSHIMKHWKRNPGQGASRNASPVAGRNVLLRFYPPQNPHEPNSRKRKVYEQHENEGNPLRCPVKLYEFYLSKCPESVKTRNDVFYLLPERSCVPESPVWYSTMALDLRMLRKMLHRVKMVKEINVALLTH